MRVKTYLKKATPSKNLLNLNKYRLEDYYGKKAVALDVSHLEIGKRYTLSTNCPFMRFTKIGIEGGSANSVHYYGTPIKAWSFIMARSPSTPTGTLYLYIGRNWNDFNTVEDFKPYFWQIEEGSPATEYEPYGDYQRVKVWNGKKSKNLWEIPYPYSIKTWAGITFTTRPDGGVHISGTSSSQTQVQLVSTVHLKGEEKIIASLRSADGVANQNVRIVYGGGSYQYQEAYLNRKSNRTPSKRITSGFNMLYGYVRVEANTTVDMVVYPMIQAGDTVTEYEPYKQALMKVNIKE